MKPTLEETLVAAIENLPTVTAFVNSGKWVLRSEVQRAIAETLAGHLPMTPATFHALANECLHAALGSEHTSTEKVERVLRRLGVVVTNLAELEKLRSGE